MKEIAADIGKGSVTLVVTGPNSAMLTYTDRGGQAHICESFEPGGQCLAISGSGTGNRILIDGNHTPGHLPVWVALQAVAVGPPATRDDPGFCALGLINGANVRVLLHGHNKLLSGRRRNGIEVSHNCSLAIECPPGGAPGTLEASSLGEPGGPFMI